MEAGLVEQGNVDAFYLTVGLAAEDSFEALGSYNHLLSPKGVVSLSLKRFGSMS